MKNLNVYDNGGKTLDRYTAVFLKSKYKVQGQWWYDCLGMSTDPFNGFGQHGQCQLGRHLGKKIDFNELPKLCKQAVLHDGWELGDPGGKLK